MSLPVSTGAASLPTQRVAGTTHPMADRAAQLIAQYERSIAALIAQRDAAPATHPEHALLTYGVGRLRGYVATLAPYLPGAPSDAVLRQRVADARARFEAGTVNGLWPDVDEVDAP